MTADTYSSDGLGLLLMGTGNDNNTWGANANTSVFQILADAIANVLTSAVTGGTLLLDATPPPAASSGARYAALKFTGILGSNQLVQVPNLNKWWLVCNATSGAFTLKFKTSGGSASTAIPQNSGWQLVRCDGGNVIEVWPFNTAQVAMGDGTVGAPSYAWLNDLASGWYRAGTQDYRYSVNGVDVLQVTGSGASSPNIVAMGSAQTFQASTFQLLSTDAGATVAPTLDLYRNSASPAASDFIGSVDFNGKDSGAAKQLYAEIIAQITDPTAASEDAIIILRAVVAGTLTDMLTTSATGVSIPGTLGVVGKVSLTSTDSMAMAKGTTAQRNGSPTSGDTRYNSTLNGLEYYNGTGWVALGQKPTYTRLTSGTGTYSPPAGCLYVEVEMVGPGAGGAAATLNAGNASANNTSFENWTAIKGSGGALASGTTAGIGGVGGTGGATGTGTLIARFDGADGDDGGTSNNGNDFGADKGGGAGGSSVFGGRGKHIAQSASSGQSAKTNTGSGGSAARQSASNVAAGGGGGAGEYVKFQMTAAQATGVSYTIGAGGTGGSAGGTAGGAGATGIAIVKEFYN